MSEYPTCPYCDSKKVLRDSYSYWDTNTQYWKVHSVYDNFICEECGEEDIDPIWITLNEQTPSNSEGQST
jgi:hypothetical protein